MPQWGQATVVETGARNTYPHAHEYEASSIGPPAARTRALAGSIDLAAGARAVTVSLAVWTPREPCGRTRQGTRLVRQGVERVRQPRLRVCAPRLPATE